MTKLLIFLPPPLEWQDLTRAQPRLSSIGDLAQGSVHARQAPLPGERQPQVSASAC